jgi:peptide deformylase
MSRLIELLGIGLVMGLTMAVDTYARKTMDHPIKDDGSIDKGRTIALYISVMLFASISSVGVGLTAAEIGASEVITYILAGLSGILGRDMVMIYAEKLKNKALKSKESDIDGMDLKWD